MKIRAASLEVRQKDKMATFTGDVYVLLGDTEMRCKQLVVFYEEETGTRTTDAAAPGAGGDRQIRLIEGHLEKFFSPSRCESDSLTAMGHGRMERASHGADGLFRC
jgi:LptA/(LptD N-terminal domain) LPS transport protein